MTKNQPKIHIIGAGISGLIAAINLEEKGYQPTIIETTDRVGGRVKTDSIDGYPLDHGFQVLLDAYPKAKEYLDYEALELQKFLPGAIIYKNRKAQAIGDPMRSLKMLFPTMTSSIGNLGDKFKILKLNKSLKRKSLKDIFSENEITTLAYLQNLGFSEAMTDDFFKPFFSGIFLEPDLQTSSRMFEFVYKMFGEGLATLPKTGIGAISEQLKERLSNTTFLYETKVESLKNTTITLTDGTAIESEYTIVATEASHLIPNLRDQDILWKSCENLYFKTSKPSDDRPLIGLVADQGTLINNIFYHDTLQTGIKLENSLLSVTVVKHHGLSEEALIATVRSELATYCNITETTFLKRYSIPRALPNLESLRYECEPSETQLTDTIFLAGDHLLNGSLNAAMISGERAARAVIEKIEGLRA